MTVEWDGEKVSAAVLGAVTRSIIRGTEAVKDEAVSLINTGVKSGRIYRRGGVYHQASAPGEAPAADTGDLARRIATETKVVGKVVEGSVTFSSVHAAWLEYGTRKMAPRPFARVAALRKSPAILQDMADEITKALK